jgi:YspA, cpYpsA-related SLOG family
MEVLPADTTIIEGEARGADRMAREIAYALAFKVDPYPADWERYGKAAGPIRNGELAAAGADLLLYAHDDLEHSRGTADMVRRARAVGIPVERVE